MTYGRDSAFDTERKGLCPRYCFAANSRALIESGQRNCGQLLLRSLSHYAATLVLLFSAIVPHLWATSAPLGVDLKGNPIYQLGGPDIRVVVLIFAASDCPIANRYVPEIARLNREFSNHGVRFWWVFPNPEDTRSIVEKHNREFSIAESTLLDTRQMLVHSSHATVTPESAVFVINRGSMREVYHGRIDDRYLAFGQERPTPQHLELEAAIAAALAGKSVPLPAGPPVGCAIVPLQP
jgi:hypothetical protein